MTISYDGEFSSLMLRWRGSLWKVVSRDLLVFFVAYYIVLAIQYFVLDDEQRQYFTQWIKICDEGSSVIPLSFILGFFVSVIVARWWEQFNWISWPDKMMIMVSTCLPGPENITVRQTIARWSSLQAVIAWCGISVRTLKRFPTQDHYVHAQLMTREELELYNSVNDNNYGKWFLPVVWISNLIKAQYAAGKIDSVQLDMLIRQLYSWRDGFAMLFVYDWIKIPLVYTQMVAIATYGYFIICVVGRQPKLDSISQQKEITILFPIFTVFQFLFYIGWLKVGQFLMNPFGEDDDDFELNYVLDRNTCIANLLATDLADQLPLSVEVPMINKIPHTRASYKIQDIVPKSHVMSQMRKVSDNDKTLLGPDDLEKERERLRKKQAMRHLEFLRSSRRNGSSQATSLDETTQMLDKSTTDH